MKTLYGGTLAQASGQDETNSLRVTCFGCVALGELRIRRRDSKRTPRSPLAFSRFRVVIRSRVHYSVFRVFAFSRFNITKLL